MGFDGKLSLAPKQINVIHDSFVPTLQEIESARTLVFRYDAANPEQRKAPDVAYYKRAKKILKRASKQMMDSKARETPIRDMIEDIRDRKVAYLTDAQAERRKAWYQMHRDNPSRNPHLGSDYYTDVTYTPEGEGAK